MIQWLRDFEGLSFDNAVQKAATLGHVNLASMCNSETISFLKKFRKLKEPKKQAYVHPILQNAEYAKYKDEPIQEWIDEGIEPEVLDLFEVRADTFANRIVYPVYDVAGNFINVKGRTRYQNYKALKIPKYISYYPVIVVDYFQGMNVTLPYIESADDVIIFESVKSVMKAFGWGYKNCLSAEKHTLTKEQIEILISLRKDVVFAFDSDVDYYSPDIWGDIKKLKMVTNVYLIKDTDCLLGGAESKNAPVDCGKKIWETLYKNRKKVT